MADIFEGIFLHDEPPVPELTAAELAELGRRVQDLPPGFSIAREEDPDDPPFVVYQIFDPSDPDACDLDGGDEDSYLVKFGEGPTALHALKDAEEVIASIVARRQGKPEGKS